MVSSEIARAVVLESISIMCQSRGQLRVEGMVSYRATGWRLLNWLGTVRVVFSTSCKKLRKSGFRCFSQKGSQGSSCVELSKG